jgi:hypothetical protein
MGESAVQIRYVTDKGFIANPTHFIYGVEGEAYNVEPMNLEHIGYKLIAVLQNISGTFSNTVTIVEFIYTDYGNNPILSSGFPSDVTDYTIAEQTDGIAGILPEGSSMVLNEPIENNIAVHDESAADKNAVQETIKTNGWKMPAPLIIALTAVVTATVSVLGTSFFYRRKYLSRMR